MSTEELLGSVWFVIWTMGAIAFTISGWIILKVNVSEFYEYSFGQEKNARWARLGQRHLRFGLVWPLLGVWYLARYVPRLVRWIPSAMRELRGVIRDDRKRTRKVLEYRDE